MAKANGGASGAKGNLPQGDGALIDGARTRGAGPLAALVAGLLVALVAGPLAAPVAGLLATLAVGLLVALVPDRLAAPVPGPVVAPVPDRLAAPVPGPLAAPVPDPLAAPVPEALFPQGPAHAGFDVDGVLLGPLPTKSNGNCKILPKIPDEAWP